MEWVYTIQRIYRSLSACDDEYLKVMRTVPKHDKVKPSCQGNTLQNMKDH